MIDASEFVAGALCLDFINTVGGTRTGAYTDKLETYGDLLEWAVVGHALTRASAGRLAAHAADEPVVAEKVLAAAKALREALHGIFAARAHEEATPKAALDLVNAWIGEALSHARLVREGEGFAWGWDGADAPDAPLWAVARDARRASHPRSARSSHGMRQRHLRLAVSQFHQKPLAPLVRYAGLRQPQQGPATVAPAGGPSPSLSHSGNEAMFSSRFLDPSPHAPYSLPSRRNQYRFRRLALLRLRGRRPAAAGRARLDRWCRASISASISRAACCMEVKVGADDRRRANARAPSTASGFGESKIQYFGGGECDTPVNSCVLIRVQPQAAQAGQSVRQRRSRRSSARLTSIRKAASRRTEGQPTNCSTTA